jgi:hypothetical protein
VLLTSLAKYLDLKSEAGQFDDLYDYGQASLLHYARWMLAHEKPYFDQVHNLEFPTEAWAAQEFRKANVLNRAALHAREPLRESLLKRGEEFADRAWLDLLRFPTRTHARSIAIMMTEGYSDCVFRTIEVEHAIQGNHERNFGKPRRFVAQKERVKAPLGLAQIGLRLLNPTRWWRLLHILRQTGSQRP